jgi:hypothetical protein
VSRSGADKTELWTCGVTIPGQMTAYRYPAVYHSGAGRSKTNNDFQRSFVAALRLATAGLYSVDRVSFCWLTASPS